MFNSISSLSQGNVGPANMMSGGGMANVTMRMQQLEAMIAKMEGKTRVATSEETARLKFQDVMNTVAQDDELNGAHVSARFMTTPTTHASSSSTQPTHASQPANRFHNAIQSLSNRYGVDAKLVNALVKQESAFDANAVSSAGAQGLMQLMPQTAKGLGVTNPMNPVENLDGGIRYLKSMMDKYNGNIPLALAAYNAGPGNVDKYDGIPPFKETQHYVRTILSQYLASKNS